MQLRSRALTATVATGPTAGSGASKAAVRHTRRHARVHHRHKR